MFILGLHEWHPIFVHFTVALVFSATIIFAATYIQKKGRFHKEAFIVAHWMLWIGAIASVATLATGFIAFDAVEHDMFSHLAMVNHREWALITFVLVIVTAIWAFVRHLNHKTEGWRFLAILLVCSFFVGVTAYKGGRLVYEYGLGVERKALPTTHAPRENIFEMDVEF